ncbi:hypothetical protein GUA87_15740 [Sneathiella sp. P13V-1]|uniref:MotE family protein n=1 Tax=Sneathiella sp. P13V-1 TaxID=2697366 RepID=UPI00187B4C24|nr:hypothetical protein [Sneathiella sp. P13V-1]MBE7638310.1 hypothetical protein [Sneathiella sp. P13V-1]
MMRHIRILPVTILAMIMVFGLKLGSFYSTTKENILSLEVTGVQAQEEKKEVDASTEGDGTGETSATDDTATPKEKNEEADIDVTNLSASEIEVLQRLVERRDQLEARSVELDLRENLLKATEKRIDTKIAKLKEIEATIAELLKKYDKQELEKLKSLVAIYEKMKPKDAARIFNSLDMEVLLDVSGLMKESKLAAILGKMNGARAKELTVELATRKQLPEVGKGS